MCVLSGLHFGRNTFFFFGNYGVIKAVMRWLWESILHCHTSDLDSGMHKVIAQTAVHHHKRALLWFNNNYITHWKIHLFLDWDDMTL